MTSYTRTTPALKGSELVKFFKDNEKHWRKADKRFLTEVDWANPDNDLYELLDEIYETLPKAKKVAKPKKTETELLTEKVNYQKQLLKKLWDLEEGYEFPINIDGLKENYIYNCGSEEIPLISEWADFYKTHFKELSADPDGADADDVLADLECDEDSALGFDSMSAQFDEICKVIGRITLHKSFLTKDKVNSKNTNQHDFSRRKRCEADKLGNTGETIDVVMKGKETNTYNIVKTIGDKVEKHGVILEDDEMVILDISDKKTNTHQVKTKKCLRRTPINKVVGCDCAIKWDFGKNIYKENDDGIWEHTPKDFGCVPCNNKVMDGSGQCWRHQNADKYKQWVENDLEAHYEIC